jgi:serine/threonine protein kinase
MLAQSKMVQTPPPSQPAAKRKRTCELVLLSPESVGNNLTDLEKHFVGKAARRISDAGDKDAAMTSLKALAAQSNDQFHVVASGGEKVAIHFNTGHMHYLRFFPHASSEDASSKRPIVYESSQNPGDTIFVGLNSKFTHKGEVIWSEQATLLDGDLYYAVVKGLTPKQQENVIRKSLEAVSKLHADGIAHRDIKLDNFFLTFLKNDDVKLLLGDVGFCVRDVKPGQRGHERCGTKQWALDTHHPPAEGYLLFENDVYATAIMIWSILTRSGPRPYEVRIESNQWATWELDGEDINAQFTETYPTFWPKVVQALHTTSRAEERPTLEEMLEAFNKDNSNNDN